MFSTFRNAIGATPWLILAMSQLTNAACECGYSVNATSDDQFATYTDLMENDFLHTDVNNLTKAGWRVQEYNVTAEAGRGTYGKQFVVDNVESNPLLDKSAWSGESENGGDAGLRLWVRGDHSNGLVSGAEMASSRDDVAYGSFRVAMKLSNVSGTCGAFYWFYNNSREIDMEFLSREFNNSQGAVNLVLQTAESRDNNFDASKTGTYRVEPLPYRPDEQFHEYRFDWSPGTISFFVDGVFVYEIAQDVPTDAGRMFLNHWSNGNDKWSAGPPGEDTAMTVSYVKSYFNTTNLERNDAYKKRCPNWDPSQICQIPDQTVAPDPSGPNGNETAKTYFFTLDGNDHAPGQEVWPSTNGASSLFKSTSLSIYMPIAVALFSLAFAI